MDQPNEGPSLDELEADDLADPPRAGGGKVREFLAGVGAFLTALLAVGGGIFVLLRDAGSLHGVNVPTSVNGVAVAAPAAIRPSPAAVEAPRASASTIYRCEVNGKTVYADAPCSSRNIRPVDVFVNEGFQPPDTSTLRARGPVTEGAAVVVASSDQARAARCKSIEEAIHRNEERARLPQPGQVQDDLTKQKRELLDEKRELRC